MARAPACSGRCADLLAVGQDSQRPVPGVRIRRGASGSRSGDRGNPWSGRGCGELRLRIRDGNALTYPAWVSGGVDAGQFTVHRTRRQQLGGLSGRGLQTCLTTTSIRGCGRGACTSSPRLTVYPSATGPGTVAVLQISHVLADGARSSAMAARLFGRAVDIAPVTTPWLRGVKLPWRGLIAARTRPTAGPRHRSGSGARRGGAATCVAQQRPTVGCAQRAHPGPAPGRSARPDGDDRRVVCGVHGAVGSSARARR